MRPDWFLSLCLWGVVCTKRLSEDAVPEAVSPKNSSLVPHRSVPQGPEGAGAVSADFLSTEGED